MVILFVFLSTATFPIRAEENSDGQSVNTNHTGMVYDYITTTCHKNRHGTVQGWVVVTGQLGHCD
jgi:hypothetical protein